VLARICAALAAQGRRAAVAVGPSDPRALGSVPSSWLVRATLPQVELLERCDSVICHGGNNTVTEALDAGRPLLTLPLSTEQFCIAADLERVGVGRSLDPNRASVAAIGDGVRALDEPVMRAAVGLLASRLRTGDGGTRALAATPARHTAALLP
jgi:UDP:flavonoid glycosyltransferase YjiC (YdhE family)